MSLHSLVEIFHAESAKTGMQRSAEERSAHSSFSHFHISKSPHQSHSAHSLNAILKSSFFFSTFEPVKTRVKNKVGKVFIEITADDDGQWVNNRWIGMLSVENVIDGASEVLEVLEETGFTKILNDNREIIGGWEGANEWIETEWMPRARALGLRKFAHLVSPGVYGAASAEDMLQRVGDKFEMRLFQNVAEAKEWLLIS